MVFLLWFCVFLSFLTFPHPVAQSLWINPSTLIFSEYSGPGLSNRCTSYILLFHSVPPISNRYFRHSSEFELSKNFVVCDIVFVSCGLPYFLEIFLLPFWLLLTSKTQKLKRANSWRLRKNKRARKVLAGAQKLISVGKAK